MLTEFDGIDDGSELGFNFLSIGGDVGPDLIKGSLFAM